MIEAFERARVFAEVNVDGIMIHSRKKNPAEIVRVCDKFRA